MSELVYSMNTTRAESGSESSRAVLQAIFSKVGELFSRAGNDLVIQQQRLAEIESRLERSRFHLAVLGQFKRGKSTFINALLGEKLLPSAVIPLTSVPTYISWSPLRTIKVAYLSGKSEEFTVADTQQAGEILSHYVTEENNPFNRYKVASVEVGYPSPLLQNGVVLIDTPGIGSTLDHNTEATMNFIPQCDAAFFLVSADPPITRVELEFLKSVQARVVHLFFIMNKVDYLSSSEQQEAVAFLSKVLQEQLEIAEDIPIYPVSAKKAMEARLVEKAGLLEESGMAAVEDNLINFLLKQKTQTLNLALVRKARDVVSDAVMRLQLEQKSLNLPLDDLENRLGIFQQKLKDAENKKLIFKDLLEGDKKRTIEYIYEQSGTLQRTYYQQLCNEVDRLLDGSTSPRNIEKEVQQYIANIVPSIFNRELEKTSLQMDKHINSILSSYRQQLFDLVESVRKAAADIFEIDYIHASGQDVLEMKHEPFWIKENWRVNWSPLPENWFEELMPLKMRMKRIRKRLTEDIDAIISFDVGNLSWSTVCNVTDSFYAFGLELDGQIQRLIESTGGAITAAQKKRIEQSSNIGPEIERVSALTTDLVSIRDELTDIEQSMSAKG